MGPNAKFNIYQCKGTMWMASSVSDTDKFMYVYKIGEKYWFI